MFYVFALHQLAEGSRGVGGESYRVAGEVVRTPSFSTAILFKVVLEEMTWRLLSTVHLFLRNPLVT